MSILDSVLQQLDGNTIGRMAQQLGATPAQTSSAVQAALPLLLGAISRNTATEGGAQSLHGAAVRDHQGVDLGSLLGGMLGGGSAPGGGGLLNGVMGALGGGSQSQSSGGGLLGTVMGAMGGGNQPSGLGMGDAILKHVLGGAQPRAAQGVANASGMDLSAVMKLLPMLAPLIMGAIGKVTQSRNLDAGGLAGMIGGDMQKIGAGQATERGFLGGVLDADGDGDVDASDLMARGSQLFSFFSRR